MIILGPGPSFFPSVCLCAFVWLCRRTAPALIPNTWHSQLKYSSAAQLTQCSSFQRACFCVWHDHLWSDIMLSDGVWTLAGRLLTLCHNYEASLIGLQFDEYRQRFTVLLSFAGKMAKTQFVPLNVFVWPFCVEPVREVGVMKGVKLKYTVSWKKKKLAPSRGQDIFNIYYELKFHT